MAFVRRSLNEQCEDCKLAIGPELILVTVLA